MACQLNRSRRRAPPNDEECYGIDEGNPLEIRIRGERYVITPDRPLVLVPARIADGA